MPRKIGGNGKRKPLPWGLGEPYTPKADPWKNTPQVYAFHPYRPGELRRLGKHLFQLGSPRGDDAPARKRIDGRAYEWTAAFGDKRNAQQRARQDRRSQNRYARVVKTGNYWSVYTREGSHYRRGKAAWHRKQRAWHRGARKIG